MSAYTFAQNAFLTTLDREGMVQHLQRGALLALSGGKDSVLLLTLFSQYAKEHHIPFTAFHLHHGIRGAQADEDASFCQALCASLGVPFVLRYADVPALAKKQGVGIEEAARAERYRHFSELAKSEGYGAVLTAHSATDHAETVLLHLLRGGGARALCGIPPVRKLEDGLFVLRPLLSLSAKEIVAALEERGIAYVTDETNGDSTYARNYVRNEILPRLSRLHPAPEQAFSRMSQNLREDADLIDSLADEAFCRLYDGEGVDAQGLLALSDALRFRVLRRFLSAVAPHAPVPTQHHVHALFDRLAEAGDFSLSFPGEIAVGRCGGRLVLKTASLPLEKTVVRPGANLLSDGSVIFYLDESSTLLSENVYTLSTQRTLTSATIKGELYVRPRKEGDAYRYGGMTHKLKKMLSDRKISPELRATLPVLCDDEGILWVPFFGARDDGVKREDAPTVAYLCARDVPRELIDSLFLEGEDTKK